MLIEFKARNFRSFRDEFTFSMLATADKSLPANTFPAPRFGGRRLLHSAAIYGANASGKSNLVAAVQFVVRFINQSAEQTATNLIDAAPFLLAAEPNTTPSEFEVTFIAAGIRYQYGFHITRERVVQEWLIAYPKGLPQTWFERDHQKADALEPTWYFGRRLKGENIRLSKHTQPNQLFLSQAAQDDHPQLLPVYRWFRDNLKVFTSCEASLTTIQSKPDGKMHAAIRQLLQSADFGIADFVVEDKPHLHVKMIYHPRTDVSVSIPIEEESSGLKRLFALAIPWIEALRQGGILFVDDLDCHLHPLLVYSLVNTFHQPESNPHHAQIIFTTYDTTLMDPRLFRRDQIWFVEKDRQGCSHLYALAEFSPRKDEAVARGYLLGRYGAIPFLSDLQHVVLQEGES